MFNQDEVNGLMSLFEENFRSELPFFQRYPPYSLDPLRKTLRRVLVLVSRFELLEENQK